MPLRPFGFRALKVSNLENFRVIKASNPVMGTTYMAFIMVAKFVT